MNKVSDIINKFDRGEKQKKAFKKKIEFFENLAKINNYTIPKMTIDKPKTVNNSNNNIEKSENINNENTIKQDIVKDEIQIIDNNIIKENKQKKDKKKKKDKKIKKEKSEEIELIEDNLEDEFEKMLKGM
jgi:hypothetical protein